ncbi:abortive infection family protein [Clostridium cochlearium]|nr:abortive infection family protein [Clostridium cochlearium]
MSTLKMIDKKIIEDLFNQNGYVLNFSTEKFDMFTYDSIGEALCDKYKLSKGKSLMMFVSNGDDNQVGKLLIDLLEYYDVYYINDETEQSVLKRYEECKKIANRLYKGDHNLVSDTQSHKLVESFNSEYIGKQIKIMNDSIDENPTEAIGKAKELLESCCKTILGILNIEIDKKWSLQNLVKKTCKELKLTPEYIPDEAKAASTIKQILGSLASITNGMAELRNPYGSGHGKSANYKGLTNRHANLAVGSAVTAVKFLWDTFEEQKGMKE